MSNGDYTCWNWIAIHPPVFGFGGIYHVGVRFGEDGRPCGVRLEKDNWAREFGLGHEDEVVDDGTD